MKIHKNILSSEWLLVQRKSYAYPSPMVYAIGGIYSFTMRKVLRGVCFGLTLAVYRNGVMYWYAPPGKLKEVDTKALELIKKDPFYTKKVIKKFKILQKILLNFTVNQIFKRDLSRVSNKKLWQLYKRYITLYNRIYTWGEPLTLGVKDSIGGELKDYLNAKLSPKQGLKLIKYFTALISPVQKSFAKKEEDDLLKIAVEVEKNRELKKILKHYSLKRVKQWICEYSRISRLIKRHTRQYCWVPYDYGVYLWDEDYFLKTLQGIIRQGDVKKRLLKSERYYQTLRKRQRDLIKKLKVDKIHQALFKAVRDCAFLLDYKKEVFTKSHYHIKKLLEEVARRLNTSKELVQFYLPWELEEALVEDKIISQWRLENRFKKFAIFWFDQKIEIYEGRGVDKIENRLKKQRQKRDNFIVEGVIACPGQVLAPVKVVLDARQIGKVKRGDVLVAPMTSPDFLSAIKKASAIITDEGGITCHAAIVSRELGIPCIIGTKIATKVLRDGQMVEVDAESGVVRVVKNHRFVKKEIIK